MQLDNTRIAIRERGMIDTYDLTLHVIRAFAPRLIPALLLGILPLVVLNELLLGWMWEPQEPVLITLDSEFGALAYIGQVFLSTDTSRLGLDYLWLIIFQAPAATIFAESYLGSAVFKQERTLWESVRDVFSLSYRPSPTAPREMGPFWAFLVCQLLLRGTLIAMLLPLLVLILGGELDYSLEVAIPLLLLIVVSAVRAFRPYINEIIVLEKNPLRSKNAPMTVGKRSSNLHNSAAGELFAQWLGSCVVAFLLWHIVFWSVFVVYMVMFGDNNAHGWVALRIIRPFSLWVVVAFIGLARFLSYLDLRIRQEGWEVELLIRAEAARLSEKLV